jgi:hypothetical protein
MHRCAAEHADLATIGIELQHNKFSRSCSPLGHVLAERFEEILRVQIQLRTSGKRGKSPLPIRQVSNSANCYLPASKSRDAKRRGRMVKKLSQRCASHAHQIAPGHPQYGGENDVGCHMRVPNRHIFCSRAECSQPCGNLKDCGPGRQNGNDEN